MSDLIGRVIGGYRIESELGRGGQAVVYRATQLSLQRTVALKVVTGQASADASFLERFTREGIAAASLDHPHVIPVFEAGEEDGAAYLAMKYIDGPSLDALIRRPAGLEAGRTLAILRQVAEALDYVGARGMVHRDVKPANVLLGPGDHAYLSDFGLIKAMSGSRLTGTGVWMGTLEYVAPEQIRGTEVTPAADRYALAALAFEALTGTAVFARDDRAATLYAHVSEPPPSASGLLPALGTAVDPVLARGLAKSPADRYPSAVAFVSALEAAVAATSGAASTRPDRGGAVPPGPTLAPDAPAGAAPPQPDRRSSPGAPGGPAGGPRWRVPAIVGGVLAAVAVVATVVALATGGGERRTVTTFVVDTTASAPTGDRGARGAFAIGAVLPAAIDGWQLAGTGPEVVGLELAGRGTVETAQATRGALLGLLVGLRPDGEDGRAAVARLRADLGGRRDGIVPLTGIASEGVVQIAGGASVVSFADEGRAFLVLAAQRDTAVALGAAASAALGP